MKKIKSAKELELEQTKLKRKGIELEKNMRDDLKGLRNSVSVFRYGKLFMKKTSEKLKGLFK